MQIATEDKNTEFRKLWAHIYSSNLSENRLKGIFGSLRQTDAYIRMSFISGSSIELQFHQF